MHQILPTALDWHRAGHGVVLCTLIETWSSAPRAVGAHMAISDRGEVIGDLTLGIAEPKITAAAQAALTAQGLQRIDLSVSDAEAAAAGLGCGGALSVLLTPIGAGLASEDLDALVKRLAQRQRASLRFDLTSEQVTCVSDMRNLDAPRATGFQSGAQVFEALFVPPLQVVLVGAGQIAHALAPILRDMDVALCVIDPRPAFATQSRFPGAWVSAEKVEHALGHVTLDTQTAMIALTHKAEIDDPALAAALTAEAFYVGALGSKRTHAARCERLAQAGLTPTQINRIHGPIGLDIGARGPTEIAISIAAELVRARRQRPERP